MNFMGFGGDIMWIEFTGTSTGNQGISSVPKRLPYSDRSQQPLSGSSICMQTSWDAAFFWHGKGDDHLPRHHHRDNDKQSQHYEDGDDDDADDDEDDDDDDDDDEDDDDDDIIIIIMIMRCTYVRTCR